MAGVWVTVCLPGEAAGDVDGALVKALAPFHIDTPDNPLDRGMWDHRHITGGSDGRGFAVAPGYWDDHRLLHDEPGYLGAPCPNIPGVCGGGPRALLDFSRPALARERAAAASWDLWHALSALHPPATALAVFVDRWRNDDDAFPDARQMLAAYRNQPLIKAYLDHPHSLDMGYLGFTGSLGPEEHPVIGYAGTRAEYIREFTGSGPENTDVLTEEGWWWEKATNHAVHAFCEPESCPHQPPDFSMWQGSEAYLAERPGDTILVRLHCHA